jgi:hypothetical protein
MGTVDQGGSMRYDIVCQSANHASRQGQAGWAATLGFVDSDDPEFDNVAYSQGLYCQACGTEIATPDEILQTVLDPVTGDQLDILVEKAKAVQEGAGEFTGEEISSIMTDYLATRGNRPVKEV